jgi:hypothetical protein
MPSTPTDTDEEYDAGPPRADRYSEASRSYAQQGEGRLAVLAQCAADVEVLQQLLWENGLDESPDPEEQLAAVGEAVSESLAVTGAENGSAGTAREAVERFRHAVVATFDESVHALLTERFVALQHLEGVPVSFERARDDALDRLAGRTPVALVDDLRATAHDCLAVAEVMLEEQDIAAALRQLWQADLATFEAYLVDAAMRAGDTDLATVALRWEMARTLVPGPPEATDEIDEAVTVWREALVGVVSAAEAASLRAGFSPVPLP